MKREITVRLTEETFARLQAFAHPESVVDRALKQFFIRHHKIKMRVRLKQGYRRLGKRSIRFCRPLTEDASF